MNDLKTILDCHPAPARLRELHIMEKGSSIQRPWPDPGFLCVNAEEPLTSLDALGLCPALEVLDCLVSADCCLGPLAGLRHIRELRLVCGGGREPDLAALAALPELRTLKLRGFRLGREPWRLPWLTRLDLAYCQVEDLSVLAELPCLTGLRLFDRTFPDLAPLPRLRGLASLSLDNRAVDESCRPLRRPLELSVLRAMPELQQLSLGQWVLEGPLLRELSVRLRLHLANCFLEEPPREQGYTLLEPPSGAEGALLSVKEHRVLLVEWTCGARGPLDRAYVRRRAGALFALWDCRKALARRLLDSYCASVLRFGAGPLPDLADVPALGFLFVLPDGEMARPIRDAVADAAREAGVDRGALFFSSTGDPSGRDFAPL